MLLAKDSRLGALLFFQSIACASIALVLLWVTLYCKKSYLTPFTIAYTILSALIYLATMGDYAINSQAEEYCVLMLWGAYLRDGRGLGSVLVYLTVVGCYFVSLACSRRGGVRRFTTFPQQRKNGVVSRAVFCFSVFTSASYS